MTKWLRLAAIALAGCGGPVVGIDAAADGRDCVGGSMVEEWARLDGDEHQHVVTVRQICRDDEDEGYQPETVQVWCRGQGMFGHECYRTEGTE